MIPVLKWGAIVGVAVYVVELALILVYNALALGGTSSQWLVSFVPICLQYFVLLFAFSAAGFYTARETGKAWHGALAGVVALIVQFVLGLIYSFMTATHTATTSPQTGINPVARVAAQIVAGMLVFGLAASMGWLGGRPGAQQYTRRAGKSGTNTTDSALPPA